MDNIYFNCILTKKIIIKAEYLNENIEKYIEDTLKLKVEGICVDEGYVKPDTIKILKKSIGMLLGSRFTGDITYNIAYTAEICNPVIGNVIDCKVKFINKLGIMGHNGPITIIVGKQFCTDNNILNKISENDVIKVEVIAKKFSLNDKLIKIVAKLWYENGVKKNQKNDLVVSDLTPILDNEQNDYGDMQNEFNQNNGNNNEIEETGYNSDETDEYSIDDNYVESDEEIDIKVENPEINETDDIDVDDIEEDEYDDEDIESVNEYD